jgi:hypothetical protein
MCVKTYYECEIGGPLGRGSSQRELAIGSVLSQGGGGRVLFPAEAMLSIDFLKSSRFPSRPRFSAGTCLL